MAKRSGVVASHTPALDASPRESFRFWRALGLIVSCAWRIAKSGAFRGLRQAGGEFTIGRQGHANELGWRSFGRARIGMADATPVHAGTSTRRRSIGSHVATGPIRVRKTLVGHVLWGQESISRIA